MKIGFLDIPVSKRNHRINASDDASKTPIRCHLELVEEETPPRLCLELVNELVPPSTLPDGPDDGLNEVVPPSMPNDVLIEGDHKS